MAFTNITLPVMIKAFCNPLWLLGLVWVFFLPACTQYDEVIMPQENCDTLATVQLIPGCGLQLHLENNQTMVPVNTTCTTGPNNAIVYKINNFPVQVGQQVIVGYRAAKEKPTSRPCHVTAYNQPNVVTITCIVSILPGA